MPHLVTIHELKLIVILFTTLNSPKVFHIENNNLLGAQITTKHHEKVKKYRQQR